MGEAVVVPIQHVRWIFGSRPRAQGLKYHPIHGIYKLMDVDRVVMDPSPDSLMGEVTPRPEGRG